MVPGQTLALKSRERAEILDRNGDELQSASLTGAVDPKTGKGVSGLQARYDKQLTGGGGAARSVVVVERESGRVVKRLTGSGKDAGKAVRTTIDPKVQEAAAAALDGVKKNAALVAVDPSTGDILAAANMPSGMNRALEGRYPPGSTFKVVTSAALLKQGMRPSDKADCPKFAYVDGQRFENQDQFVLPSRLDVQGRVRPLLQHLLRRGPGQAVRRGAARHRRGLRDRRHLGRGHRHVRRQRPGGGRRQRQGGLHHRPGQDPGLAARHGLHRGHGQGGRLQAARPGARRGEETL